MQWIDEKNFFQFFLSDILLGVLFHFIDIAGKL